MILIIQKVFNRVWAVVLLLNLVFIWLYKPGMTADEHGSINRTIFITVIVGTFSAYGLILLMKSIYGKSRLSFWVCMILALTAWLIIYFTRVSGSCDGWENGIGGRYLDNDSEYCEVPIPTF